jgi:hypothetical protein
MQNENTPPQEQSEPVQLTAQDKSMIIFALGALAGLNGLDENRKITPLAQESLRVARKFGVNYER